MCNKYNRVLVNCAACLVRRRPFQVMFTEHTSHWLQFSMVIPARRSTRHLVLVAELAGSTFGHTNHTIYNSTVVRHHRAAAPWAGTAPRTAPLTGTAPGTAYRQRGSNNMQQNQIRKTMASTSHIYRQGQNWQ